MAPGAVELILDRELANGLEAADIAGREDQAADNPVPAMIVSRSPQGRPTRRRSAATSPAARLIDSIQRGATSPIGLASRPMLGGRVIHDCNAVLNRPKRV